MLNTMRKYAGTWLIKFLLGAIVVVFVFWGVGGVGERRVESAAVVNDVTVPARLFWQEYKATMERMEQQFGDNLSDEMIQMLNVKQQTLDRLINAELIRQEAQKLNITISDEELKASIQQIGAFQRQGNFDITAYQKTIARVGMTTEDFEQYQRDALLQTRFQSLIEDSIKLSDMETLEWYIHQNTEVNIEYVFVDPSTQKSLTIETEALTAFYETHKEKYKTEAKVKVRYLHFNPGTYAKPDSISEDEIKASYQKRISEFTTLETVEASHILIKTADDANAEVIESTRVKAAEIAAKAKNDPNSFAELAKQFSDDTSRDNGGRLEPFTREKMVKPFSDAAFSMQSGDISDPVRSKFGWHIIMVHKNNPGEVKPYADVKDDIRNQLAFTNAKSLAQAVAVDVDQIVFEADDLINAATEKELEIKTTDFFGLTGPSNGISDPSKFATAAFKLKDTNVSEILDLADGYYILQVTDRLSEAIKSFNDAEKALTEDFLSEKRMEAARNQAQRILDDVNQGTPLKDVAASQKIKIALTGFFKRNTSIPGIGYNYDILNAAFSITKETPMHPEIIEAGNGFYIVSLAEIKRAEATDFEKDKEKIKQALFTQKKRNAFAAWIGQLKTGSTITVTENILN